MTKIIPILLFILILTGCKGTSAPECSSEDAKKTVTTILEDGLLESLSQAEQQFKYYAKSNNIEFKSELFEEIEFSLVNIRTTEINEKLGSFQCKAEISAKFNNTIENKPITFTSEQTDGGKGYYIQVMNIPKEDQGVLLSVLFTTVSEQEKLPNIEDLIKEYPELTIYEKEANSLYSIAKNLDSNDFIYSKELRKKNKCKNNIKPEICLNDFYKKHLSKLGSLVIEQQQEGNFYLSVKNVKSNNDEVIYLALGQKYQYGIISSVYWSAFFDGKKIIEKTPICSIAVDEEDKFQHGDKECNTAFVEKIFNDL